MAIKAIETSYGGCRFRSRLEARWAVFFDTLHIEWQYEPQGFATPYGLYLPDFWLSVYQYWVEIKGELPTQEEYNKLAYVKEHTIGSKAFIFAGDIPRNHDNIDLLDAWNACIECGRVDIVRAGWKTYLGCGHNYDLNLREDIEASPVIQLAYNKARSARFEHGESG